MGVGMEATCGRGKGGQREGWRKENVAQKRRVPPGFSRWGKGNPSDKIK